MSDREHIPTVASGYGAFLHALDERPVDDAPALPAAQVRGRTLRRSLAYVRRWLTIRMVLLVALALTIGWLGLRL